MTKVCRLFSPLLQLFPRVECARLVRQTQAERQAEASPVGGNWSRGCSASWGGRIRSGSSVWA